MADKKMTKVEYFEVIRGMVEGSDVEMKAELLEFIDTQVGQIKAKAEKAKAKAAEKKAVGDQLQADVFSVITDEFQTVNQIVDAVQAVTAVEDVTRSKVVARLTKLVTAHAVAKEEVKVEGASKKVMAYKLGEQAEDYAATEDAE